MTKNELKTAMLKCIEMQDDIKEDEWYCTNRQVWRMVIEDLALLLNIKLKEV